MSDDVDLTADERQTLACALDALIPGSENGRFPAASEVDVAMYVRRRIREKPSLRAPIREGLDALDAEARRRGAAGFAALGHDDREAVLRERETTAATFFATLLPEAYSAYYQHPRVLDALGLEARPPFPAGHRVAPSDLAALLEPVRARPKMYRPG